MEVGLLGEQLLPAGYWRKVLSPRKWSFPRDHSFHPEYAVEWHYLSGNFTVNGEPHGYHLCQFVLRGQVHTHFSVSSANGWFGLESPNQASFEFGPTEIKVSAKIRDGVYIDLSLTGVLSIILQGENQDGFSRKSNRPYHASHYYSIPRLRTNGTILASGQKLEIKDGVSWFDHEFADTIKQDGFSWAFVHADMGEDSFFNCYLMFDDGEWVKEHSRASLNGVGLSEFLEIDHRLPTVKNPNFTIDAGIAEIRVRVLNDKVPLMFTSIGDYLELPCSVEIGGKPFIGMLEIPKP